MICSRRYMKSGPDLAAGAARRGVRWRLLLAIDAAERVSVLLLW